MSLIWTETQEGAFRDAYLDWLRLLQVRRAPLPPAQPRTGTEYEPIFVRLTSAAARTALTKMLDRADAPLIMDIHERSILDARIADPDRDAGLPDEYALYRVMGTPDSDHESLFDVLDTGVPVRLHGGALPLTVEEGTVPPADSRTAPIIAILDDGIGFLNRRFCHASQDGLRSRFHAIWLQALERDGDTPRSVVAGQMLTRPQIETLFATPEDQSYARLNAELYGPGLPGGTNRGRSHGTHMLDLAAGADPDDADDPVRNWPLLGVQLPPESIADTSGTVMESYLLQGLRWILRQARQVNPDAPVMVNISLGFLAGPKDGTRFAEYQLAREARLWEEVTGQPVRLVFAFGNNRLGRLVARKTCAPGGPDAALTWRAQPCDQSTNFLEIRAPGFDCAGLDIALTTPDGMHSGFAKLMPGQMRTLTAKGKPVARIYQVAARDFGDGVVSPAHYVLALAPTEGPKLAEPTAPGGAWTVKLRNSGSEPIEAILQVQRDDGLYGRQARQSYLDDPAAFGWSDQTAAYDTPDPAGPVTQSGTHSALCTSRTRQSFTAGAARKDTATARGHTPERYTAEGADWAMPGPTVATPVGQSPFRRWISGAGTLSGTTRLLGGTSAAAARLTRALGLSAARIVNNVKRGKRDPLDDLDPTQLDLQSVRAEHQSQLGQFVVRPLSGIDANDDQTPVA